MKKKLVMVFVVALFAIGMFQAISAASAANSVPVSTDVSGNNYQGQLQAREQHTYRFMSKTQIRMNSSVNVKLNMSVDAKNIGEKTFQLNITSASGDLNMSMVCTQEQSELGLLNGSTVQTRERNTYTYTYGFALQIHANASVNATLGFQIAANESNKYQWAYYNETAQEWVPVESTYENGVLYCTTDHFSSWTILTIASEPATIDFGTTAFIIAGLIGIAGLLLFARRRIKAKN